MGQGIGLHAQSGQRPLRITSCSSTLAAEPLAERLDRTLERGVFERDRLAAIAADEVMVVMAPVGHRGLVAGRLGAKVQPLHELQVLEHLERPVDGRDAHLLLTPLELVRDVLGGDHAALAADRLKDRRARAARLVAVLAELRLGNLGPFG